MIPDLAVHDLYKIQRDPLKLRWLAGKQGSNRRLESTTANHPGLALVGHLNLLRPHRVQIIGNEELAYFDHLSASQRSETFKEIANHAATAAIIHTVSEPCDELVQVCNKAILPLFFSALKSPIIIELLQYYLTRALAPRIIVHGVFIEVMGTGVLITGECGMGKSELALELISRNHRLIVDDAVELIRVGPEVLIGQCTEESLGHFLEVRGLGILNISNMYGETAVRRKKKLHFIIRLEQLKKQDMVKVDRLQSEQKSRSILDVEIPEEILFVAPGRNLATLLEAATRTYMLKAQGNNALLQLEKIQQDIIEKKK